MPADMMRTRRDVLDGPPTQPRMRSAPRESGLRTLASDDSPRGRTPDDADRAINSPEGEHAEADDPESELNNHPVVRAFDELAQAKAHLTNLGSIAPELMMPIQDLLTALETSVPQWAAMKLSGSTASAGMPQPAAMGPAGPSSMGLQSLAGGGGVGAGPIQSPVPMLPSGMSM